MSVLLIIGCILILFGMITFFYKNQGKTIIDLLIFKIDSNNSAILMISLGVVLIVMDVLVHNKELINVNKDAPITDTRNPDNTNNGNIGPKEIDRNNVVPRNAVCEELQNLIQQVNYDINEIKGSYLSSPVPKLKVYEAKKSLMNLPADVRISPEFVELLIYIPQSSEESIVDTWNAYVNLLEECYPNVFPVDDHVSNYDGNPYLLRYYQISENLNLVLWKRQSNKVESTLTPVSLHIMRI